jgi:dolichol-phosphate mannosyltransferase
MLESVKNLYKLRIARFATVGLSGVFVNEGLLWFLTEILGIFYLISSLIAIEISIVANFILNEFWTFKDRVSGRKGSFKRLGKYNLTCVGSLIINVSILFVFTNFFGVHYLVSNMIGIIFGFIWNYSFSLFWTWKAEETKIKRISIGKNPKVSLVIPTYNESKNIEILIPRIFNIFERNKINGELIIVDDNSPDGTGRIAEGFRKKYNVKVVHRKGKLGLSSAVLEGFKLANGEILGVMDADLSHPPETIPRLIEPIRKNEADMTIGSRHIEGGKIEGWTFRRKLTSKIASLLARGLTNIKDPISGFFFLRRDALGIKKLNPIGFKIGLEILVKSRLRKKEIPYVFVDRKEGKSKMGRKEIINYLEHLTKLYLYKLKSQ